MSDLTVRFPVVFGSQRDRPRRNVVIVPPADATAPETPTVRATKRPRTAPADGIAPGADEARPATIDAPTSRTARSLALATLIQRKIDAGQIQDQADAARLLGVTPANMNYIMNLRYLAADIQDQLLTGNLVASERSLRPSARMLSWEEQHRALPP